MSPVTLDVNYYPFDGNSNHFPAQVHPDNSCPLTQLGVEKSSRPENFFYLLLLLLLLLLLFFHLLYHRSITDEILA
jgi:hypothetical protein